MIDVVYIVGTGSRWDDNELRYSLRSLEYLNNVRDVIIVGDCPAFVNKDEVRHFPFNDQWKNAAKNIAEKIVFAAITPGITENFAVLNDDYFFLKPIDISAYPYYHKGTIAETIKKNGAGLFSNHLEYTRKALVEKGFETMNFDTHCPIIYNSDDVTAVVRVYDWTTKFGYTFKSLYCNTMRIAGEYRQDFIIKRSLTTEGIKGFTENLEMFAVDDHGLTDTMKAFLASRYPNKCCFEL